ncbi:23S rRNA (uracil(747)-C(5))-methyltransferase RlmC [Luteimicrobium sp. NPDC057192]|uniref:23S rRNA (uracil(747)-C(5))-methyltransferase RlmC n=1 Tax=Luteimicrobium sp. NPDC057192 TaxID=3346042 RepID=UPI003628C009
MQCPHFDAGECRSCALMGQPYPVQVADKEARCRELLDGVGGGDAVWLEPFTGPESGFRNKAKMVVTGTVDAPVLGILDHRDPSGATGVDLTDCGLYPASLQATFGPLAAFVTRAGLAPYDVATRRGELKYLIVTQAPSGELMVRWVLRSQEPVARIRKHLGWLRDALPGLAVASVNVQPEHKAILEGDLELVLTERETLTMRVGGLDLHLRPQSFFQTNTTVATALYDQVAAWVDEAAPARLWDLYCGVGGFALHCAAPGREVVGVETSREAVASAALTARDAGLPGMRFVADDATAFALAAPPDAVPDLVVVNPPRRGIGPELAGWLEASGVRDVVYSSCNAVTLARDLAAMPSLRPTHVRLLDMFPQTHHYEVVARLTRR